MCSCDVHQDMQVSSRIVLIKPDMRLVQEEKVS